MAPFVPKAQDAAHVLADLAQRAFDSGLDWSDPKAEGRDGPRSAGLLDAAADCFLYPQTPRLRMSWGANCPRARYYDHYHGDKGKNLAGGDRMRMAQGYVFERLFLESLGGYLDSIKGPWRLDRTLAQTELAIPVNGQMVTGHPDAVLTYEGKPWAVADCKQTSASGLNYWQERRFPGAEWGYRHQAGNYLKAFRLRGVEIPNFVWFLSLRDHTGKHEKVAVGWAEAGEVASYAEEAQKIWLTVLTNPGKVPMRVHADCGGVPCQTPTGIECRYLDFCRGDKR